MSDGRLKEDIKASLEAVNERTEHGSLAHIVIYEALKIMEVSDDLFLHGLEAMVETLADYLTQYQGNEIRSQLTQKMPWADEMEK